MTRKGVTIAAGLAIGVASLGGCASGTTAAQPAWYTERASTIAHGYPSLRSVPHGNIANTNQAHWDSVEAEMVAAGAALKSNPRAEPAPPQDPNGFIEDARAALEATRQSHE